MNLSGHQSARMKSDVYLTPPEWINALGSFDLDPCCPPDMPWKTAETMWSLPWYDGLQLPWPKDQRVWLNPPFGSEAVKWLRKLADQGQGIALIPARTETEMFYECVWNRADAICFVRSRPYFRAAQDTTVTHVGKEIHVRRGEPFPFNSGAPIALVAYGGNNVQALIRAQLGFVSIITAYGGKSVIPASTGKA